MGAMLEHAFMQHAVLAGLCAEHKTVVENCHFIRRGYEDIVRDFRELGADIGTETEI